MQEAVALAKIALERGEIPVGALVVHSGEIISTGFNSREKDGDIFGHAEINALKAASEALGSWRLSDCILYSTLEPCAMCAAACVSAQLKRIVFGAFDPERGACGSALDLTSGLIGKRVETIGGVYEAECSKLLRNFFKKARTPPKAVPKS